MANLVKALKSAAKENRIEMEQFSAVSEANRLIAYKGAEDMEILRSMGMHKSIDHVTTKHAKKIELENLEKEYGSVFTEAEIKKVACKYALKFLRSDKYCGAIDPEMLVSIKKFFADNGRELNEAQLGYKCFILGPSSSFNLSERPPKDPILFYHLENGNYKLIHKWGSDLTLFRRLIGLKYINKFTYVMSWVLTALIPAIAFTIISCNKPNLPGNQIDGTSVIAIFLYAAAGIVALCLGIDSEYSGWRTEYTWETKNPY